MIDNDLIPYSIRWKKSMSGLGIMYSNLYNMLITEYDIQGVKKLNYMMYDVGFKQSLEILKELDLERNLEGCAYVLLTMHRLFGLKSKIVEKQDKKVVIHVSHCSWGDQVNGWTPRTCNSIANYETGIVRGILPDATHHYVKKRSLGNDVCELIISIN